MRSRWGAGLAACLVVAGCAMGEGADGGGGTGGSRAGGAGGGSGGAVGGSGGAVGGSGGVASGPDGAAGGSGGAPQGPDAAGEGGTGASGGPVDDPDRADAAPDGPPSPPPDMAVPPPPPPPPDVGVPPPPPPVVTCEYRADDFGAELREYDVMGRSDERLRFTVQGLPDPAGVVRAVLAFDGYDLDHPGAEGRIWINQQGPYEIPARVDGDNMPGSAEVDVTGTPRAGDNRVEFGSSLTEARTYFRIGRVALRLDVQGGECPAGPPPPPPPPPEAVERSVHYRQAEYTQRHNWVVRCNDYAFTAHGEEHLRDDCDGRYDPDGSRRGTAIFRFPAVVEAEYEVIIRSRHTVNRNPRGALFIVNGEERRVNQRDDADRTDDLWGRARLSGDVTVILDSSRESESDSVISVRLRPVGR